MPSYYYMLCWVTDSENEEMVRSQILGTGGLDMQADRLLQNEREPESEEGWPWREAGLWPEFRRMVEVEAKACRLRSMDEGGKAYT